MSDCAHITLFIPTRNRPHFLGRLLQYYQRVGFSGTIFVGDASDAPYIEHNKTVCDSFRDLQIRFFVTPDMSSHQSMELMATHAETPYSAAICDDDFLCPHGLQQCATFLDAHPSYVAAHGKGAIFGIEQQGDHGTILYTRPYPQAIVEEDSSVDRFTTYFARCDTLAFSLHRTSDWKELFKNPPSVSRYQITFIFGELIHASIATIRGKVKELDCFYLLRQAHDEQKMAELDIAKWLIHPEWYPTYRFVADCVVDELQRLAGLDSQEANTLFERTFGTHLAKTFVRYFPLQFNQNGTADALKKIRSYVKAIPGLKHTVRTMRSFRRAKQYRDPLSLTILLHPSSKYYADFLPLYQVITETS